MKNKTRYFETEKLDRILFLMGRIKATTSEIAYYHYASELDELLTEFYEATGKTRDERPAIF